MTARPGREAAAIAWRVAPAPLSGYLLVTLAEALAPVAAAWLTKLIIDGLAGTGTAARLLALAAGLAGVGLAVAVLPHAGGYLGSEIGRRFELETTDRLFAATTALPGLRPFENPHFLDRLRLAHEGSSIGGGTVTGAFAVGRSVVMLAGFVGSLLVISPVLAAVVLGSALPALAAHVHLSRRRAGELWQLGPTERRQLFYRQLLGQVDAAKEIRLFGSGAFLRGRLMGHLRVATAARRRMDRRELAVAGALALLAALMAGGGLVWAVDAATTGALSPGDITMFVVALACVQAALAPLVGSAASIHYGLLWFGHFLGVVRAAPDLPVAALPAPVPRLRHGIELRDVWFRYSDGHPWVLKGVNLSIPAGATVALVGLNGAGKSTLVKLLCRFYDPDRGAILWDGIDLRQVRPEALRARISGVFQDHLSYELSAEDNIAIGDVAARGDLAGRIRAAAGRAGLAGTIDALPYGYHTQLSRMALSSGQWQRMALARAYFRDGRDLMILDEPGAGLDPRAEAELHERTRRCRTGQTSLLISHRLHTVRDADLLFVLDGGVVTEQGTHQELIDAGGSYADLFQRQAAGYQPAIHHLR
jgi:ATP-binding cassette, subfamily B, bacterial